MLLEVAEGRQRVCICVGAMQNDDDDDYYYFSETVNARTGEFFSEESLTTKNALSISLYLIWLHHRVYVSSASLPLLFKISGKSICRLIF